MLGWLLMLALQTACGCIFSHCAPEKQSMHAPCLLPHSQCTESRRELAWDLDAQLVQHAVESAAVEACLQRGSPHYSECVCTHLQLSLHCVCTSAVWEILLLSHNAYWSLRLAFMQPVNLSLSPSLPLSVSLSPCLSVSLCQSCGLTLRTACSMCSVTVCKTGLAHP